MLVPGLRLHIVQLLMALCLLPMLAVAQTYDLQLSVYTIEDGLSDRNVFKTLQDEEGFLWIATMNGLNRFDGHQFLQFNRQEELSGPDAVNDMLRSRSGEIILSGQDQLTFLNPATNQYRVQRLKEGPSVRREARIPYSLFEASDDKLWSAVYDERQGASHLEYFADGHSNALTFTLPGTFRGRPFAEFQGALYVGGADRELWQLDQHGDRQRVLRVPGKAQESSRIVALQVRGDRLYVLLLNGTLYWLDQQLNMHPHPLNQRMDNSEPFSSFYVSADRDIWLGGEGRLLHYDPSSRQISDYDGRIRSVVKQMPTYRHIFEDRSGVIWVSSDFGLIKLVRAAQLFSHYMEGGNPSCSNYLCSMRGMCEDEQGRVYLSYYNSIHVFDPDRNTIRPLFPAGNYFNYPYDLLYHQGAIYTGNGRRIDLESKKQEDLLSLPQKDLGVVEALDAHNLVFGFEQDLYLYDSRNGQRRALVDSSGLLEQLNVRISAITVDSTDGTLLIGSSNAGLFRYDLQQQRVVRHLHAMGASPRLLSDEINAILWEKDQIWWLATAEGLQRLDLGTQRTQRYTTQQGLSNTYINGILPEGDSALWVSTNYGLNRLEIATGDIIAFFERDGISSNEFNRNSFLRSSSGRLYFGGLDGINAFWPDAPLAKRQRNARPPNLLFTNFTHFSGAEDSIVSEGFGLSRQDNLHLSYRDRYFSFSFSLADYRQPQEHKFSYLLEGYDEQWSAPSSIRTVRYNNIPAGDYTFRVRALRSGNKYNEVELSIPISVSEPFYRTLWFWLICSLLISGVIYAVMRYRIYLIEQRRQELEAQVQERTQELQSEKQKSDRLLLNILPAETAEELKQTGMAKARRYERVTVMFADFKGFTQIASRLDPEELVTEIDQCFSAFDRIMDTYHLEKIKTIGDAYMCMVADSGHQNAEPGAERLVRAAIDIQDYLKRRARERDAAGLPFFEARIGIHSGPVVAGVVGTKKFAYDIWGDTVNIASRMESKSQVGGINLSETTYALVRQQFSCQHYGKFINKSNQQLDMYLLQVNGEVPA